MQNNNTIEFDASVVKDIVDEIVSYKSDSSSGGGYIRKCVTNHLSSNEVPLSIVDSILLYVLKSLNVQLAYSIYKVFRTSIVKDENSLINFLNYATGIAKKKNVDATLIDNLYIEYYFFLHKSQKNPEDPNYIALYNSAVNYYVGIRKYENLLLFLGLRNRADNSDGERTAINNAEFFLYQGFSEKQKGEHASAIIGFRDCISHAKKITDKATKEKYTRISYSEIEKCKQIQSQFPAYKFFDKLDYEGAYKYFLKLHNENPENDSITSLFNKIETIYDRSATRIGSLPIETKKGKYFRLATAAEVIEENLPRAEKLWKKSIEVKEPGRLAAIKSYISVLIREKKYVIALEECKLFQTYYSDIIDRFGVQIKVVEIYSMLGEFDEAIKECSKINSRYKSNKEFVSQDGQKRLAYLLSRKAALQSKELGLYVHANDSLNNALEYGLEKNIYASSYINNCMQIGDYKAVKNILKMYSDVLSDEYVYSVRTGLQNRTDFQLADGFDYLDTYSSKGNEKFFEWYLGKCLTTCPGDIKEYLELDDIKEPSEVRRLLSSYPGYDSNLNAQIFLNALAANFFYEKDGYASKTYYVFLARSILAENRIRLSIRRNNVYLAKYASIALFSSDEIKESVDLLVEELGNIALVDDDNKRKMYVSILLGNNPVLKISSNELKIEYIKSFIEISGKSSYNDALSEVNNWINKYNAKNKMLLESKTELLTYIEADKPKAEQILVKLMNTENQLLEDDKRHVEHIIDINRGLNKVARIPDYMGKYNGLEKSREKTRETRRMIEEGVTPFCLLLWIDVLDRFEKVIDDEQSKIDITLAPRISISVDNGAVFSSKGKIRLNYSLSNDVNCAQAKEIAVSFEDGEGNSLVEQKDVEPFNLSGGESRSLEQDISRDTSFSLIIRVTYSDMAGNESEVLSSESIIVNKAKDFEEIINPFTTSGFDPNDKKRVFVGREEIINSLKQQLTDASINCAVLYGQKRTGKTSIFKRLEKELADAFVVRRVSMSSVSSMDKFYKAVKHAVTSDAKEDVKKRLKEIDTPTDRYEFEEYIEEVTDIYGKKVLLLLDEFSHLYDLIKTPFPEEFMNEWKELMEYSLFSAIITGQETLGDLIKIYANQFAVQYTVPVEYISNEYFRDLVDKPILMPDGSSRYKEKSLEKLWSLTKGHPYLCQNFCDSMVKYLNANKTDLIFDATIDKVMDNYIVNANEKDFDSFYNRYSKNAGEYAEEVNATLRFLSKLSEECANSGTGVCDVSRLGLSKTEDAIKTSLVRRGVIDIDENNRCEIRVKLFYEWLRKKGKNLFSLQSLYEEGKTEQIEIEEEEKQAKPSGVNIGTLIYGDQILTQDNRLEVNGDINQVAGDQINNKIEISINKAVECLERLQELRTSNNLSKGLIDEDVQESLANLPFNSGSWQFDDEGMEEEKTIEYAEKIFKSPAFINKELTEIQKSEFHLSNEVLEMLSPECRSQIICGIQVYDLIQYCIDTYGMEMSSSESPRGILFARAFENHMKDCLYQPFRKISPFMDMSADSKNTRMNSIQKDKTTIGTYTTILDRKDSRKALADASTVYTGDSGKDLNWWKEQNEIFKKIGKSRNDCCHSGHSFGTKELEKLLEMIFEKDAIRTAYLVKQIVEFSASKSKQNTDRLSIEEGIKKSQTETSADANIGKVTSFTMKEKTPSRSVKGTIFGDIPARISQKERAKIKDSTFEIGKKIRVRVTKKDDGVYVVKAAD